MKKSLKRSYARFKKFSNLKIPFSYKITKPDRMPPPSYCSKNSARSTVDPETIDNGNGKCRTDESSLDCLSQKNRIRYGNVGIVKTLLGPSLEDAVLRTLEFGKSLIHCHDDKDFPLKGKKIRKQCSSECAENKRLNFNLKLDHDMKNRLKMDCKGHADGRPSRKRIVFTAKLDRDIGLGPKPVKKLTNVSKIRSLDSDLKQVAPSPEKIKRQLEALIQINKDEPPEQAKFASKTPKTPLDVVVMPSFCTYKNQTDFNLDVNGSHSKHNEYDVCSTSRGRNIVKKRPGPACKIQAPEFLSNALGPSLDVSIMENITMMRDLLKCDSGKGEGATQTKSEKQIKCPEPKPEIQVRLQHSEEEMCCRIEELQKKIEELEEKEQGLIKRIEEEDRERECKKRAFEEEEKKLCTMKTCLESLMEEEKKRECGKMSLTDNSYANKYENLKQRIACEEEKLMRLKDQQEKYKREICEAQNKREALKRNKSLLDAWDVIASRVCHTRLPSFSRVGCLERKNIKQSENFGDIHCCLPISMAQTAHNSSQGHHRRKSRSRSRSQGDCPCSACQNADEYNWNFPDCKIRSCSPSGTRRKREDIPFPIQRDIICGLHQLIKTCSCRNLEPGRRRDSCCSQQNKFPPKIMGQGEDHCSCSNVDTAPDILCRKPNQGNRASCSKSDTAVRIKSAKICKVMWAVTRINIFQDNCRTYEVMDATSTPPPCIPAKTEGIFVVKSARKQCCQTTPRRKIYSSCS